MFLNAWIASIFCLYSLSSQEASVSRLWFETRLLPEKFVFESAKSSPCSRILESTIYPGRVGELSQDGRPILRTVFEIETGGSSQSSESKLRSRWVSRQPKSYGP